MAMRGRPLKDRMPPEFWERVEVALVVGQVTFTEWSGSIGKSCAAVSSLRARGTRPPDEYIDALCALTGCTREFLFNPEPVDLSK